MAYPPGMTTVTVELYVDTPGGKPASGEYRVEAERKFGYTGSTWVMQRVTKPWSRLLAGWMRIELPHTNQAGLIGDTGGALAAEPAFKFSIRPTNDSAFGDERYVKLPTSLGTGTVALKDLIDLGGWPNAVITTGSPAPSAGNVTYTESPAGSGLYTASVS